MIKDYLNSENERNHHNHLVYERFLRLAFGPDVNVLVAHHITFTVVDGGDPNEVPSADTLMFDHELMGKVFGKETRYELMVQLALQPAVQRDRQLEQFIQAEENRRAGRRAEEVFATESDAS